MIRVTRRSLYVLENESLKSFVCNGLISRLEMNNTLRNVINAPKK